MISILLADDHAMVRKGFRMILEQQPDFKVVDEAADMDDALLKASTARPKVVVSDISMGGEKRGLLLAQRIVDADLPCRVVMLTMHAELEYLLQAFRLGAMGYVLKSSSDTELVNAVRRAAAGEMYVCEAMMSGFVQQSMQKNQTGAQCVLTPRESELVTLAVQGYSNTAIAEALSVSVKTVESQKTKIMQKLGLDSKPELFAYAAQHGLLGL